jgi:hypothetical protein
VTFGASVNTVNSGNVNATTSVNSNALVKFSSASIKFSGGGSLVLNGKTELKATTFNGHYAMTGTRTIATTSTITYTNAASLITPGTDIPSATLGNLVIAVGGRGDARWHYHRFWGSHFRWHGFIGRRKYHQPRRQLE